jgi:adenine-specific DNA-methyltransferase
MKNNTKAFGQFPTPEYFADFVISLSSVSQNARILEPACGEGIFLKLLEQKGYSNLVGYEIDATLKPITNAKIIYQSFVAAQIQEKFALIIGNPPFIRWKNLDPRLKEELEVNELWQRHFNSLCDYLCIFILKSVELLEEGGELVFVTPEYWINTKHAEPLRSYLTQNGYFKRIIHFNETPIFDKVASSILVFVFIKSSERAKQKQNVKVTRYCSAKRLTEEALSNIKSGIPDKNCETFERGQFQVGERWMLATNETGEHLRAYEKKCAIVASSIFVDERKHTTLGDIADIGNGMVSGLDRAFQIPKSANLTDIEKLATIPVLKAKHMECFVYNEVTSYIFLDGAIESERELREKYPAFYGLLRPFVEDLNKRYCYNREIKYWEWVFPRSYNLFKQVREKIFVPCKERISHKSHFRFSYVPSGIFPTQDVTGIFLKPGVRESVYYILALLNSEIVFDWLRHKGVVKGNIVEFSEKPLASIPVRMIDWEDPREARLHEEISSSCKELVISKDNNYLKELRESMAELFATHAKKTVSPGRAEQP